VEIFGGNKPQGKMHKRRREPKKKVFDSSRIEISRDLKNAVM
jgi:hypothetical protein